MNLPRWAISLRKSPIIRSTECTVTSAPPPMD
nr:MAG TPA: hypothetical protein [Caudoviricetes sp.]